MLSVFANTSNHSFVAFGRVSVFVVILNITHIIVPILCLLVLYVVGVTLILSVRWWWCWATMVLMVVVVSYT